MKVSSSLTFTLESLLSLPLLLLLLTQILTLFIMAPQGLVKLITSLTTHLTSSAPGTVDVQLLGLFCDRLLCLDRCVGANFSLLSLVWKGLMSIATVHWGSLQGIFRAERALKLLLDYTDNGFTQMEQLLGPVGQGMTLADLQNTFTKNISLMVTINP